MNKLLVVNSTDNKVRRTQQAVGDEWHVCCYNSALTGKQFDLILVAQPEDLSFQYKKNCEDYIENVLPLCLSNNGVLVRMND